MTERFHAVPCPVCPGLPMSRIRVGAERTVEIDICRRCGGLWLDRGEVQQLRALGLHQFALRTTRAWPPRPAQCHACHAVLDRDSERCPACHHDNRLTCPVCEAEMLVVVHGGIRLDVCQCCQGAWFDHHELDAIWGPSFESAVKRREQEGEGTVIYNGDAFAFDALFFAPELIEPAVTGLNEVAGAMGSAAGQLPELLAASPEIAAGLIEVVGDAAVGVLEVAVEIVSAVFD
ncbi:MAG: zf-TFIIB domain-containing protein [Gemmatimonadales bacterium]|nr:zf-TFIIB domain-containing protein [Gemmatimonadales bacterium]